MMTNKTIAADTELASKARRLMVAAHDYWMQYRKDVGGPSAVVWVDNENGHFVLFTRGEYKDAIMASAHRECAGEVQMFDPFEAK